MKAREPFGFDVEDLVEAADAHATSYGEGWDHPDNGAAQALGDLVEVLRAVWEHLDDEQKRAVCKTVAVENLRPWTEE